MSRNRPGPIDPHHSAASGPCLHVFADDWRAVDRARAEAARRGLADRIAVHHRGAIPLLRGAGERASRR